MIKVVAKNYVQEDKMDEVMELNKELVEATRKEEGCISYAVYQDEKDATILTMIEEWENRDVLKKHMHSEHFTRIVPMLRKLRTKETEMNIYKKIF